MPNHEIYSHPDWRALSREGECALVSLLGGECRGPLGLHHVEPISEGGDPWGETLLTCQRHHALLHGARRRAVPRWKHCPHKHPYREGRIQCERKLNRELLAA